MVSIMPGIDIAEPERTDTSSGFAAAPKPLPVFFSSSAMLARTSAIRPAGSARVLEVGEARGRRDDESRRNIEADLRHRAQVRPLATQQHLVAAVAVFECADEFRLAHGRVIPARSEIDADVCESSRRRAATGLRRINKGDHSAGETGIAPEKSDCLGLPGGTASSMSGERRVRSTVPNVRGAMPHG